MTTTGERDREEAARDRLARLIDGESSWLRDANDRIHRRTGGHGMTTTGEPDWEEVTRNRLARTIGGAVSRLRDAADQIEREAKYGLKAAAKPVRDLEFRTYARVAGSVVHELLYPSLGAVNIIDAAADADAAWKEKQALTGPTSQEGSTLATAKRQALEAVLEALDGWIEGARDNHEGMGHRHESVGDECWRQFAPEDIRNMINDAARSVGIGEFPRPNLPREDMVR